MRISIPYITDYEMHGGYWIYMLNIAISYCIKPSAQGVPCDWLPPLHIIRIWQMNMSPKFCILRNRG